MAPKFKICGMGDTTMINKTVEIGCDFCNITNPLDYTYVLNITMHDYLH